MGFPFPSTTALSFIPQAPAHAGFWADYKAKIEYRKDLRNEQKKLENVINTQLKYSNSHNLEGLSTLYTADFMNNDGYLRTRALICSLFIAFLSFRTYNLCELISSANFFVLNGVPELLSTETIASCNVNIPKKNLTNHKTPNMICK